jgi:hypothetical protein
MLTKNLNVTYSMVWSIAIANLLGSGLCFAFSGQFAKLATLRYTLILPVVLCLVYIGAFEGKRQWGDLYSLLFFGLLGWALKHFKWPRPPLVLGFILGAVIERYMFISIQRYGGAWMLRPLVLVMFAAALWSLLRPFVQDIRAHGGLKGMASGFGPPRLSWQNLFPLFLLCLFVAMMLEAVDWSLYAKIVPLIIGSAAILFCTLTLANEIFKRPVAAAPAGLEAKVIASVSQKIHMDIASNVAHLPAKTILVRGMVFFGWMAAFLASMALIGLIPTIPLFIVAFMRIEGAEPWRIVIPMALIMTLFVYGLFDQLLSIPWPGSLLGELFPVLKDYLPSA